jgi:hypothetical protein
MVDLLYPKPVQDVGHERLESHVLHACDELSGLEVLVCGITTPFAEIVNEVPRKPFERMLMFG